MESKLSGIIWAKMVAKNIVLGSPGIHFMHMRVKNVLRVTEMFCIILIFNILSSKYFAESFGAFFTSLMGSIEIGDKRIRGHETLILKWGLKHVLGTSTHGSGKFQAEPVSFNFVTKRIPFKCSLDLHFYTLIIGFFRSA